MNDREQPKRRELMPDTDPELLRAALNPVEEPEPDFEFDPDDPGSAWLLGDDPEADVQRTADRRNAIKRQIKSEGAQFVYGLLILAASLGSIALAATIRTAPFYIAAAVICPIGFWMFRSRWKRWLGSAPYCYQLLTSLGEDAENMRIAHEEKQRKKYVNAIGDLYEHSRGDQPPPNAPPPQD
ncbi:MAG: hypothetical protein P1U30_06745 [Phycisphaerales bacterium]|nr:hypothetical protein [Phycisphaerales bacterium]